VKSAAQLALSIDRFREGFWERRAIDHPPVGVYPDRCLLPVNYLKSRFPRAEVTPADLTASLVRTDFEEASFARRVISDDWMPFSAAWRAVPWLEAVCGCAVPFADGSLSARPFVKDVRDLAGLALPGNREWVACLREQTAFLVETSPPDCWVSPTIIRGLSDTLGGLRGLSDFFLDIYDAPEIVDATAARISSVLLDLIDLHFEVVPAKFDGYGHIFGYWAPGPSFVLQEDMMGLCSPELYRDHFKQPDARIVERLGPYTLFHLHSTGYQHYRHLLEIPGLAGLELTVEANGPSLLELAPVLREILEQMRLVVFVDAHFAELAAVLRQIPHEGLYLIVSDRFLPTDEDYQSFVTANF
jgi:hypothetical protein